MASPDEPLSADGRRVIDAMRRSDGAVEHLGIEVVSVSPGRARAEMTVAPEMTNGHAVAHGGMIFTLADTAFAYACNTVGEPTVARQCEITFLRPAEVGDRLVADAELRSRAGRAGIYDVSVRREGGDVVAELRGHSATLVPRGART